jgi:integrase
MRSAFLQETTVKAIKSCLHWRDWLPYQVSIETGLRIGDVLALRWCNIEPSGRVLFMAKKTGKIGDTYIRPSTLTLIKSASFRSPWLFPGQKAGKHLTRQAAWYRVKKACKLAKIDAQGISPHSFRKIFAVEALRASGDLSAVQKKLQHDGLGDTALYAFSDKFSR